MFGFAKKIGMTRLFLNGKSVPVTALAVDKQYVLQTKTIDNDGYQAVQVGSVKKRKGSKAILGHIGQYGLGFNLRFIEEFRDVLVDENKKTFDISDIAVDDNLDITGTSLGRGFAGAVKRHGFHGQPASHGHDHVRAVGSIGSRWPQRTLPGKKMAGHMGSQKVTIKKAKVVAVDPVKKLVFINGSLPGGDNSYLRIQKVN